MIVLDVDVAGLERCRSRANVDGDCLFGNCNRPEQSTFGCAGIEVVNLSTIQVEDIKSNEREGTVVVSSISPDEFPLHEAHVRVEEQMS